jgi:hypothetical protein
MIDCPSTSQVKWNVSCPSHQEESHRGPSCPNCIPIANGFSDKRLARIPAREKIMEGVIKPFIEIMGKI